MFLGDIFQVRSGLVVARKKVATKDDAKFKYKQLNLRSINKNGYINIEDLEVFQSDEKINYDYLTAVGDIIIRLSEPYTAIYITKEYENLVITSNFAVIKRSNLYTSEFIAYYLNGDFVKKQLYSNMQGSIVRSISISAIEKIELPKLTKHKQELFAKLAEILSNKLRITEEIKNLEIKLQKNIIDKMSI